MRTIRLAGVDVPRIGLGTNRLTTAPEHVAFVREAVAAGVRHIDSAHLYSGGDSERAIGQVGISEVAVEQIERARRIVEIAAVQNRYNLADRRHDEVVDYCEREGIP